MQNKSELPVVKKPGKDFWLQHVNQWKESNLSQQAYCNQARISYSSFGYWRKQILLESGEIKPRQFLPVEVKSSQSDKSDSIKVKLNTGNIVCIPINIGIPDIAKLIRLLEDRDA